MNNDVLDKTPSTAEGLKYIPEDEQNKVIAWGQGLSQSQWWLGRLVLERISHYDDSEHIKMSLYRAFGMLSGLSSRTIRMYVSVCKFFSEEDVEKYNPLPFSHFQFAIQFGENAYQVLDESMNKMISIGRPPSREWLEWRFAGYNFTDSEQEYNEAISELDNQFKIDNDIENIDSSDDYTGYNEGDDKAFSFNMARLLLNRLLHSFDLMNKIIAKMPIENKDKLFQAQSYLDKAEDILRQIEMEIG